MIADAGKKKRPGNNKKGNHRIAELGKDHQWKPGQSGNPNGTPKAKVVFWRYVQEFSEMTTAEIGELDTGNLSQSQLGAMKFVEDMVGGKWNQIKEALDRDEGPIAKTLKVESDQPSTLIINKVDSGGKDKADLQLSSLVIDHKS